MDMVLYPIECTWYYISLNGLILPNNIQNAPSVKAFKYAYKKLKFKHRNTH